MSKKQHQYIYNQPIYTNTNQTASYGTYHSTNYHQTSKTKPQNVVYQQQYVEQSQPQYVIEGNNYTPEVQYVQGTEYVTQDQGGQYIPQEGTEYVIQEQGGQYIPQEQGTEYVIQDQGGQYITQEGVQYVIQDQGGQYVTQEGGQYIIQDQGLQYDIQPEGQITYEQQVYQQQPNQNVIYQEQKHQQIYEQNPKIIQQQQKKAKFTNQMVKQKPNIKQNSQYQQQEFVSRNPNKQQYQNQNIPQQYIQNVPQPKYNPQQQNPIPNQQNAMKQDKPLIESEFVPNFPLENSVIGQSQIHFDQNQKKKGSNTPMQSNIHYQNQNQMNQPSGVTPIRNPNANLKKYNITNSSHYVNTSDPGYKIVNSNNINNSNYINQNQGSNKGSNIKSKIPGEQNESMKYVIDQNLEKNANQLLEEEEDIPEIGAGITCISSVSQKSVNNYNDNINNNNNINNNSSINKNSNINNNINNNSINNNSITNNSINNNNSINYKSNINKNIDTNINMSGNSNIKISGNSNIKKSGNNNIKMSGNSNNIDDAKFIDNQLDLEEMDKEKPIEEKVPDVSNMENPENQNNVVEQNYENYQPHYAAQEVHESKLKESIDLDDNMDKLPTINSIMKGTKDLLPPQKKKKYDD